MIQVVWTSIVLGDLLQAPIANLGMIKVIYLALLKKRNCTKDEERFFIELLVLGLLLLLPFVLGGCRPKLSDQEIFSRVNNIIAEVSRENKLNDRETVYEISARVENGVVVLSGKASDSSLKDEVVARTGRIKGVKIQDGIEVLPSKSLGSKTWAIVKEPVINLGDAPGQSQGSHTVTQAKIGDILYLLELKDGWYRAKMEDNYLGWVDAKDIAVMDKASCDSFFSGKVVMVKDKMTPALDSPGGKDIFSKNLTQGTILPLLGFNGNWVAVGLPGGGKAYVRRTVWWSFQRNLKCFPRKREHKAS